MRSGDSLTKLVEFSEGFPDGDVTWVLVDGDNVVVDTDTVTPVANSASCVITISGANNTVVDPALYANRELRWSYSVGGLIKGGTERYRVDGFLKFGVSEKGVRGKLGVEAHEIEDSEIDLVSAYSQFENTVTAALLDAVSDAYTGLIVCDAIEAIAALRLVRQMQVKIAQKEVSGVSQYARATIKWDAIEAALLDMIAAGYSLVNPALDATADFGSIFLVVVRDPDPVTGTTPA